MSPTMRYVPAYSKSFPRVSGDEPQVPSKEVQALKFSPRERG